LLFYPYESVVGRCRRARISNRQELVEKKTTGQEHVPTCCCN
jgi:hypothetical protein